MDVNYLFMLALNLNHVSKRGHWRLPSWKILLTVWVFHTGNQYAVASYVVHENEAENCKVPFRKHFVDTVYENGKKRVCATALHTDIHNI